MRYRQSTAQRRLLLTAIAVIATLVVATPTAASTEAGGPNHVVLAFATADGSSSSKAGLQVAPAAGPTVASSNIAVATSFACTGCRSVAIAFQAVLVTGDASTISPANAAVANNLGCTSCTAYAFAYQYVLSTGGPVHLSLEGRQKIGDLRAEINDLADSGLAPDELTTELNRVKAEFKSTIDNELVESGQPVDGVETSDLESAPAP